MGRKWANIVAKETAKAGATQKYMLNSVLKFMQQRKGDPDPETNTALKFVIDRAKQAQVLKHVIDKAIDKAKIQMKPLQKVAK